MSSLPDQVGIGIATSCSTATTAGVASNGAEDVENLTDLDLAISYGSAAHSLVRDFYTPCLRRSVLYRRGVGYFTSHGLALAAQGVAHLIANGGCIQLIASPSLTEEDVDAINHGYRSRTDVLRQSVSRSLEETRDRLVADRLQALAWLITNQMMDVKLALRVDDAGRIARGIYHEKLGIFTDRAGNSVAFVGSSNETAGGLADNFESIEVFWSWNDPHHRVDPKIDHFEALWNDSGRNVRVIDFTQVTSDLLRKYRPAAPPTGDPLDTATRVSTAPGVPRVPKKILLREYQEQARDSWFANHGRGILKMATGTGKTITALSIAARLSKEVDLQAIVIVCPFRHLVTQWRKECHSFEMRPILAFESRARWHSRLLNALYNVNRGTDAFLAVITTNVTFATEPFQMALRDFPRKTLFIVDEVHNVGAPALRGSLPDSIGLRLGLSATPERWFDDDGTSALLDYFGPVLQPELTLADALERGDLTPYRYYPVLVNLTDAEQDEYLRLSALVASIASRKPQEKYRERLTTLLMRRARLVASAAQKLEELRRIMQGRLDSTHTLVYCGDGRVEDPISNDELRHVDTVCRLLGRELGFRVSTYTATESTNERASLQKRFESGDLQGLVAIRCLDEGLDIPLVRTAVILASSTNPRQFIQRRGRILRRAPGKDVAEIFDMIVTPPDESTNSEMERRLLEKELLRFREFADLALNAGVARSVIFEFQKKYDLTDI